MKTKINALTQLVGAASNMIATSKDLIGHQVIVPEESESGVDYLQYVAAFGQLSCELREQLVGSVMELRQLPEFVQMLVGKKVIASALDALESVKCAPLQAGTHTITQIIGANLITLQHQVTGTLCNVHVGLIVSEQPCISSTFADSGLEAFKRLELNVDRTAYAVCELDEQWSASVRNLERVKTGAAISFAGVSTANNISDTMHIIASLSSREVCGLLEEVQANRVRIELSQYGHAVKSVPVETLAKVCGLLEGAPRYHERRWTFVAAYVKEIPEDIANYKDMSDEQLDTAFKDILLQDEFGNEIRLPSSYLGYHDVTINGVRADVFLG